MNVHRMQQQLIRLRDNKTFEWSVIAIIIVSSLLIGVKTYSIDPVLLQVMMYLDYAVTLFFLFEILIRLGAADSLKQFFSKGWNVFDFIIVTLSLIPLDDSEYALLARLLRLFRVLRLISFVPELRVLVSALLTAIPRMGYVALLMFVIFYLYAVAGSLMFAPINPVLWGDMGVALLTLFRVATFEDWTDVMYETMEVYPLSWVFYISFIFFSAFVFLNMMIGIVVGVLEEEHDKMDAVKRAQKEADAEQHLDERFQRLEDRIVQRLEAKLSALEKRDESVQGS